MRLLIPVVTFFFQIKKHSAILVVPKLLNSNNNNSAYALNAAAQMPRYEPTILVWKEYVQRHNANAYQTTCGSCCSGGFLLCLSPYTASFSLYTRDMPPCFSRYSLWSVPVSFHANIPRLIYTAMVLFLLLFSLSPWPPNGARQMFVLYLATLACLCDPLCLYSMYTGSFLFLGGGSVALLCACSSLGGERTCSCCHQCRLENLCRLLFSRFWLLWLTRWTENPFRSPSMVLSIDREIFQRWNIIFTQLLLEWAV